jgi:DNA-binding XRE family transcriptional regulator
MNDFREHLQESLSTDSVFKEEWDTQATEREVMKQIVAARIEAGMSQTDLAKACGMRPANLCRLENGNGNPSIATLDRIARGLVS